jgi:hypothetical protein
MKTTRALAFVAAALITLAEMLVVTDDRIVAPLAMLGSSTAVAAAAPTASR